MKKASLLLFIVAVFMLIVSNRNIKQDSIYQTSTIDALLAGVYDGETSLGKLLEHGNFGIGTFDHLDGEMLVLDSTVYQIKSDGKVYRPELSMKTPFATVCNWQPEKGIALNSGLTFPTVEQVLNEELPNQNLFYGIKISGTFKKMKTRSVPGQKKPYPPLKEVTKNQPEFMMEDVAGTIVGFRSPPFVKGINVPGYHLHFISKDRKKGGHILSFEITEATCSVDIINKYSLDLPRDISSFAKTDLTKDRSKELHEVEK